MRIRTLSSVAAVMDAIGRERLMEITGRGSNNLTNWKAEGFFPPVTYVVITAELSALGFRAPARLWRMIGPRPARRAA